MYFFYSIGFSFLYFCEVYCNYMYWLILVVMQHAKKVLTSSSVGQVYFANRLLNSVLVWQASEVFWGVHFKERTVINPAYQKNNNNNNKKTLGLVHVSNSSLERQ